MENHPSDMGFLGGEGWVQGLWELWTREVRAMSFLEFWGPAAHVNCMANPFKTHCAPLARNHLQMRGQNRGRV